MLKVQKLLGSKMKLYIQESEFDFISIVNNSTANMHVILGKTIKI